MGELTRDAIAVTEREVTEAIQKGRAKTLEPAAAYTLMKAYEAAEAQVAALRDRVERTERALAVSKRARAVDSAIDEEEPPDGPLSNS